MQLESPAFANNAPIPTQYAGNGQDLSPPLRWDDPPEQAAEFALLMEDPDAPTPQPFVHWIAYRIPAGARELKEGLARDTRVSADGIELRQGVTSFGADTTGYRGPMPPPGHGTHHYHFHLYALRRPLELGGRVSKERLMRGIQQAGIIGEAELVGLYER